MLLVHPGLGKTGTTHIQRALYLLSRESRVTNFIYPNISGSGFGYHAEVGTTSGNANLLRDFAEWNHLSASGRWDFALSRAEEVAHDGATTVLSSENLAQLITKEFFWEALSRRNALTPVVAVYLRGPFSHFLSSYVTRVKFGYTGTLEQFVDDYLNREEVHSFMVYANLSLILQHSSNYSVPIQLFHYEKRKDHQLMHFLNEVCKLNLAPDVIESLQSEGIHPRLSMHKVEFQRGVNSESLQLGRLLGWESTSILRNFLPSFQHPDSRDFELSIQARATLNRAFQDLQNHVREEPGELAGLDCEIDETLCTDDLGIAERAIRAEIFDLGRFVARSYHDGYIAWNRN